MPKYNAAQLSRLMTRNKGISDNPRTGMLSVGYWTNGTTGEGSVPSTGFYQLITSGVDGIFQPLCLNTVVSFRYLQVMARANGAVYRARVYIIKKASDLSMELSALGPEAAGVANLDTTGTNFNRCFFDFKDSLVLDPTKGTYVIGLTCKEGGVGGASHIGGLGPAHTGVFKVHKTFDRVLNQEIGVLKDSVYRVSICVTLLSDLAYSSLVGPYYDV